MRKSMVLVISLGLLLLGSIAYVRGQGSAEQGIGKAIAVVSPTQGSKAKGIVTFTKVDNGIKVVADLEGLTPGLHGFHVHQYGDCTALNGDSAGGHFNPEGMQHGAPAAKDRHVGDLGNLAAVADGKAHLEWTDPLLSLEGRDSIIGRSVIVHGNADDLTSQPAGNSGPRIGCGVIGIAGK
jgi:Cu-Zn family superoxide dismutase